MATLSFSPLVPPRMAALLFSSPSMSTNVPRVREVPRHNGRPFVFIHPFKRYDKPSFTRSAAIWAKRPTGSGAAYPLLVDVLGASNKPAGATDGDGILSSSFRLIPSLYLFLFLYFSFCLFNVFFLSYAFVFYVL